VEWLIEIVDVFELSPRSTCHAMPYFDTVYAANCQMVIPYCEALLLAAACLHTASKVEDCTFIDAKDMTLCGDR
jgi:hypothetical protein